MVDTIITQFVTAIRTCENDGLTSDEEFRGEWWCHPPTERYVPPTEWYLHSVLRYLQTLFGPVLFFLRSMKNMPQRNSEPGSILGQVCGPCVRKGGKQLRSARNFSYA